LPTAIHADGPLQDTASSVENVPSAPAGTLDHVDPFHVSPHASSAAAPTAKHADGPLQDTAFRPSVDAGRATSDHFDPFHDSFTVPTAAQNVEPLHDTPVSSLFSDAGVAGLASTDHETPGLAWAPAGAPATIKEMVATRQAGTSILRAGRCRVANPLGWHGVGLMRPSFSSARWDVSLDRGSS
jgi:hypothetical protein